MSKGIFSVIAGSMVLFTSQVVASLAVSQYRSIKSFLFIYSLKYIDSQRGRIFFTTSPTWRLNCGCYALIVTEGQEGYIIRRYEKITIKTQKKTHRPTFALTLRINTHVRTGCPSIDGTTEKKVNLRAETNRK